MEGKLHHLRTANDQDAVMVVPRDPFMILLADINFAVWFLYCTQHIISLKATSTSSMQAEQVAFLRLDMRT
jgi:hypothetical protein